MSKRANRKDRERLILIGLVEYYLKTGKPVGSSVLQETGFRDLSSATIRNYFAELEEEGFLKQLHASGGRIPLSKAFHLYAEHCLEEVMKEPIEESPLPVGEKPEFQDVVPLLQETAAQLSARLHASVVLSSPRFDHDSIIDVHFHFIDVRRALAIVVSEFGLVHTQLIMTLDPLSPALIQKADAFAKARIHKHEVEQAMFEPQEMQLVRKLYQEAVSSFFVSYSSFSQEDIWKAGFSYLLEYPEFEETESLTASLSLFENSTVLRGMFREVQRHGSLRFWIGDTLKPYVRAEPNCAFIAIPYRVGTRCVGAIGVLGPQRMFYKDVFCLLRSVSVELSHSVTSLLGRERITYRMAEAGTFFGKDISKLAVEFKAPKLLTQKQSFCKT